MWEKRGNQHFCFQQPDNGLQLPCSCTHLQTQTSVAPSSGLRSKPREPHSSTPACPGGNVLGNSSTSSFFTQAAPSHEEALGISPVVTEARLHQSAHKEEGWGGGHLWKEALKSGARILPGTQGPDGAGPTQSWAKAGPACPQIPRWAMGRSPG